MINLLFTLYFLIFTFYFYYSAASVKQLNNKISHPDADKGGDEASQLEGVVNHVFAYAGGASAVEAYGSH